MNIKLRRLIFRLICAVYPRFPVQRALWMVRLYAGEGLSQRRISMLEEDARDMLRQRRQLDALRILHCGLLLSPKCRSINELARKILASKYKMRALIENSDNQEDYVHHQINLKMHRFSSYVMRAVEQGGYRRLAPPDA